VTPERWKLVKSVLAAALERRGDERPAFLEAVCGEDSDLRGEVESLLAAAATPLVPGAAQAWHDVLGSTSGPDPVAPGISSVLASAARLGADQAGDSLALQAALAGRYSLTHELGRGGMGVVYLARDVALERSVAIKLLPPSLAADPGVRASFLREARTAAGLAHPHIVPIHLVEERDGMVFFVMSHVDGETLAQRIRRAGALPVAETLRLLLEVAQALRYAHGRGVIHRDIKPANILLERGTGRALVTDFGIAQRADGPRWPSAGRVVGTVHFMSPEQARGEPVDARTDLYSLGVTAFYMLTARLPFDAPALPDPQQARPAPRVQDHRPDVPPRLAAAIDRCLSLDPAARFPSADAFAAAVGGLHAGPVVPPVVRRLQRAFQLVRLALAGFAVIVAWIALMAPDGAGPVALLLGAVWGLAMLVLLFQARQVQRAGLAAGDVAAAFELDASQLDDEATGGRLVALIQRPTVTGAAGVLGLANLVIALEMRRLSLGTPLGRVALAAFGTLLLALAGPVALGSPRRALMWSRLWAGSFGRGWLALAGIGLPRPDAHATPATALLSWPTRERPTRGRQSQMP
jgi:serine/threonine-protein kinase